MSDKLRTYDLSDIQTEEGFYKTILDLYYRTRNVCLPAIVTKVQDENGLVTVQPMANFASPTGDGMVHTKRAEVRVWPIQFRHGGYKIHAPLFVGDTGYIIPGDRNCLAAMSANGHVLKKNYDTISESPNKYTEDLSEFDMNKWEYGFFMPSSWEKPATKTLPNGKIASDVNPRLVIANVQEGDKSAYITIDQEGNIVIHGAKLDIEADTHIEGNLDVSGDITAGGDIHLSGKIIIDKHDDDDPDNPDDPQEDESAELVDTDIVTGLEGRNLKVWHGKVMRTEGSEMPPIPIPGGGGGDVEVDDISISEENGQVSIKGYKTESATNSVANALFGIDGGANGNVMMRPNTSTQPSFASIGTVGTGNGLSVEAGEGGNPEINLDLEEGDGITIEDGENGKKKISSTCVTEVTASANVTTNAGSATSLSLTATKEQDGNGYNVHLSGNIAPGGGGGIKKIEISSNAVTGQGVDTDSPATKIIYNVDGGDDTEVDLIPDDAVTSTVDICVGVTYDSQTRRLTYQKRQLVFKHGVLMNVTVPEHPDDEVLVFEAVEHLPED